MWTWFGQKIKLNRHIKIAHERVEDSIATSVCTYQLDLSKYIERPITALHIEELKTECDECGKGLVHRND